MKKSIHIPPYTMTFTGSGERHHDRPDQNYLSVKTMLARSAGWIGLYIIGCALIGVAIGLGWNFITAIMEMILS